jgi:hypothetical protein
MLHDAGRTLGAQHTAVHGMIGIALDVAQLAITQMHLDAAAAGAHVTGGVLDFVRNFGRGVNAFLLQRHVVFPDRTSGKHKSPADESLGKL